MKLQQGDTLLLYTDGLTEAHNEKKELYGKERAGKAFRKALAEPEDVILERMMQGVKEFAGDAPQFDDITMMVLRNCAGCL